MIVPGKSVSWFRLIFEVRGSALSRIRGRLLSVFVVACAVAWLSEKHLILIDLTPIPFTLIGLALGVFLGFRNNTAYDRFWEGRRLWGRLINLARSFARMTLALLDVNATPHGKQEPAELAALKKELIYRVIAYVHALRQHLRRERSDSELEPFLPAAELSALASQHNRPIFILQRISDELQRARALGWLRERDVILFETCLNDITDVQGGCERILNTPMPWSYTVLIHSIVATYCLALPFGIVAQTKWLTPLVTALIAYAFLGLDAVGDEIEQPFGHDYNDLPLSSLTRTIEINLRQALGEQALPPFLEPDARRVLS